MSDFAGTTGRNGRPAGGNGQNDEYEIRDYEPGDRDAFLDLYETVLGSCSEAWFRWKYEDNPYADHVPIVLATTADGTVVGAKPCFPLELRAGDETIVAYQPADACVRAEHMRRGLFSRATERTKERYADGEPSLFFNFPNRATLSGNLKHGWGVVGTVPAFYRIQRPDRLLERSVDERLSVLSSVAGNGLKSFFLAREALLERRANSTDSGEVVVTRYRVIPNGLFVDLYRRSIPGTFHANRDETFYRWRYDNPRLEYEAYVAHRDGRALAGVIVGTRRRDGRVTTALTDVVPLEDAPGRSAGLAAILERVIADRSETDLVAASGRAIDPSLLKRFGFYSDHSLPLSLAATPTTQIAFPLAGGDDWSVSGRDVSEPSNWTITFAEQDTM